MYVPHLCRVQLAQLRLMHSDDDAGRPAGRAAAAAAAYYSRRESPASLSCGCWKPGLWRPYTPP